MAYLIRIGLFPRNRSGVGSRGYTIRRSGRTVRVWWGGIEVRKNGSQTLYYWASGWPMQRKRSHRTIEDAIEYRSSLLKKMMSERLGYQRLPAGVRFRS